MPRTSRRHFAKTLTVLPLAAVDVFAQTPEEKPPVPLGKALAEVVRAEFGNHLNDEELERIGKDFQDYVPLLERLRAFKLANSDEPDVTFSSLTRRW